MVNINDVEGVEIPVDEEYKLEAIFKKQKELVDRYHPIEMASGLRLTEDCPVNLHDPKGQVVIKDYSWRFIEEIGEALEAFNLHPDQPNHCQEELSDALHFLTELTIHAGFNPGFLFENKCGLGNNYRLELLFSDAENLIMSDNKLPVFLGSFRRRQVSYTNLLVLSGATLEAMGKTCNTLKNKPWKQTHMLTDLKRFEECLKETWLRFIGLCLVAGIDSDMLFNLYMGKNAVNQFRIRSKY